MSRAKIFLSHISEEGSLATLLKDQIETSFLGLVDVFVSSNAKSLALGTNWLNEVTEALRTTEAMLILCSEVSIERPWINFEAGAAWARNIEIVPICHSGLRPVDLPIPLSLLQGVAASDREKLQGVFSMIAGKLRAMVPTVDIDGLLQRISDFEAAYRIAVKLGSVLRGLKFQARDLFNVLAQVPANTVTTINGLPDRTFGVSQPYLDELQKTDEFSYNFAFVGISFGPQGGGTGNLTVRLSDRCVSAIKAEQ